MLYREIFIKVGVKLTTGFTTAYSSVTGIVQVAPDIADLCINQSLAREMTTV